MQHREEALYKDLNSDSKEDFKIYRNFFFMTNFTVTEVLDKQIRIKISNNNISNDISIAHSSFSNFQILRSDSYAFFIIIADFYS